MGGLAGNRVGGNNDKRAGIEPAERLAPALHFSGHQADLGAFVRRIEKAHGFGIIITGIHVAQA